MTAHPSQLTMVQALNDAHSCANDIAAASGKECLQMLQTELSNLKKALNTVNHLAAELDINAAMDNVRNVALELLDCDKVTLFLVFERRNELRGQPSGASDFIIKVKFGEGIAGTVAQTGEWMNIPDAYQHPLFNSEVDKMTGYRTRNLICCAISDMTGKNVAVLQALNKNHGLSFTNSDINNLRLFGTHLGNTLAKAKLHEKAKREQERLVSLYHYFKLLNTADDLGQVLDVVNNALHEVLHAEHALVFLLDQPRRELWSQCRMTDKPDFSPRVRLGESLIGTCAQTGLASCVADYDGSDQTITGLMPALPEGTVIKNVMVQPLFSRDKVLGVVLVLNKRERGSQTDIFFEDYFTEADEDAMALFALEVGDALGDRSLEVALASALSVVSADGTAAGSGCSLARTSTANSAQLLRSQLMSMYFESAPEYRRSLTEQSRKFGRLPSVHGTSGAERWQGTLNKLGLRRRSSPVTECPVSSFATAESSSLELPDTFPTLSLPVACEAPSLVVDAATNYRRVSDVSYAQSFPESPSSVSTPTKESGKAVFFPPDLLQSWEFDFTSFSEDELVKMCYDIFLLSGTVEHFNLNTKTLRNFLTALSSHYRSIPYHNFNHVCHVLHTSWMLLQTTAAKEMLSKEEQFALLLSAVCHDVDHDGHSNSYHVNTQSELACIYNDISVLENHHCAMTFAIMRKKECALLDEFDADVRKRLRKMIVGAILSTDMSHHYTLTQDFKKHSFMFDASNEANRLLLIKVLLHSADIGNGVRPFHINDVMSRRVHREFQAQAEEELQQHLPITFCVDSSDPMMCAQVELNFLDYVVFPLWEQLVAVLPELQPALRQLESNRQKYSMLAAGKSVEQGDEKELNTAAKGSD